MVIHASLSTYAERLLTNSMRNFQVVLIFLYKELKQIGWWKTMCAGVANQKYSLVLYIFAGMGQWSTPLDL